MAYVPFEKIHNKYDNIFKLVLVTAKRALELSEGAQALVPRTDLTKVTTIAINEVLAGKVGLKEEAAKKPAKAKK